MEHGAQWVHGTVSNPLYTMLEKRKIPFNVVKSPTSEDKIILQNGIVISPEKRLEYEEFVNKVENVLFRKTRENYMDNPKDMDESLGTTMEKWKKLTCKTSEEMSWCDHILTTQIVTDYGMDPSKMSCWYFDIDNQIIGGDLLCIDGYVSILEYFAKDLNISLNSVVTNIDYSPNVSKQYPDSKAIVKTKSNEIYLVKKAVIVTIPLVSLKFYYFFVFFIILFVFRVF